MQYSIVTYSHHAIHYVPRTYLFYNWEFVRFDHFHPFCPSPQLPTLEISNLSPISVNIYKVVCCVVLFCWLLLMRSYSICLCLTYSTLAWCPQVIWQDFILFYGWIIFHCIYINHTLFIHSSINGYLSCFHILVIVKNAAMNRVTHISYFPLTIVIYRNLPFFFTLKSIYLKKHLSFGAVVFIFFG